MFGKKQISANSPLPIYGRDVILAFRYSSWFVIIAFLFLLSYSIGQAKTTSVFLSILGMVTIIAFASFAAGGIIGFLFGIPHSNPNTTLHSNIPNSTPANTGNSPRGSNIISPNTAPIISNSSALITTGLQPSSSAQSITANFIQSTNLEQIADWLTKIFVGVGLIQIHKIIGLFTNLCSSLGSAIQAMIPASQHPNAEPLIGGIIILFTLDGFLIVYLWTYLYLIKIQEDTGRSIINTIDNKLQSIDLNNKVAIDKSNTQLDLPQNAPDIPIDDLIEAFANASTNVISAIFFKAVSVRKQNWKIVENRFRINRTIPIFKALIQLDSNFEYPENFAELGYALKDKEHPEYKEALNNFNKAIESFDQNKTIPKTITYFNRAYCRIMLDENLFKVPPSPSTLENKNAIQADLDNASKDEHVANIIKNDPLVIKWKTLNTIK